MSRTACLHECLNGPYNKTNGTAACVLGSRKLKLSVADELLTLYLTIGRKMQVVLFGCTVAHFLILLYFYLFFNACFLLHRLHSADKEGNCD